MPEQHLDRPELPNVCIVCGEPGGLTPRKLEFGYVSRRDELLSMLFSLLGFFYHRELVYTLKAPVCSACTSYHRWSKIVIVLMIPNVFVALFAAFAVTSNPVPIVALPVAILVGSAVLYAVLQMRGAPKAVEVNDTRLVVYIKNHGEFTIYDEAPDALKLTRSAGAAPASQRRTVELSPRLNRSVCEGCGFINFATAAECKKCASPLDSAAVA